MQVSELMEYPKIEALMEKYWLNNKYSGTWGEEGMTEKLNCAFTWDHTEEGHDFWWDLDWLNLEQCKAKYPEYFTKEEVNKVDIEYLKEWPKLHARAEHILSNVGEVHSLEEAAEVYYDTRDFSGNLWDWEGVNFWSLIDSGEFTLAQKKLPELFEVVPTSSSNEPTTVTKDLDVLGLKPTVKEIPKAKDLIYYILSTPDNDPPIIWEHTLTSCDLLPVMQELDDFIEEYELNWSVEANFYYNGGGYLEITDYYKDVVGKTSKVILGWEGSF